MKALKRVPAIAVGAVLLAAGVGRAGAEPPPEQTYDTEQFSITWVTDPSHPDAPDLTDEDSDGVPDAVEAMAAAFEAARSFELGELGYQEPPGDERYPLYVAEGAGTGYARELPGGNGDSKPSFIAIPPRFVELTDTEDQMRAFAAHEYMHAIQIGYDSDEDHWISEASSAWVEDRFVDDADPVHHLLEDFLPFPREALNENAQEHEYGAFIFLQFLTERYGGGSVAGSSIVREMWEEMAVPEAVAGAQDLSSYEAIEAVLARRGVSLDQAWAEFLLWSRRLRHFEEGSAYKAALEDARWPTELRSSGTGKETCRLTGDSSGRGLEPLSGDYVVVEPGKKAPPAATAVLTVEGPPGAAAFYMLKPSGGPRQEEVMAFDSAGVATASIPFGSDEIGKLTVGLGNGSSEGGEAHLAYSVRFPERAKVEALGVSGQSSVSYGTGAVMSGEVTCAGRPAAFADVIVTETEVVSGLVETYRTETDASGRWTAVVSPGANANLVTTVQDPLLSAAESPPATMGVRLNLTGDPVAGTIAEGSPVTFRGVVAPPHPGIPVTVEFRRPEGAWRLGGEVPMDAQGNYELAFVLPKDGVWELRARVADTGDEDHEPGETPGRLVFVEPAG